MEKNNKREQIKIIRRFRIEESADKMIQQWAEKNGFLEGNPTGQYLMDENNHAYCFYKKIARRMICILIDPLDCEVRVEAWVMDEVVCGDQITEAVWRLFDMLDSIRCTDLTNK